MGIDWVGLTTVAGSEDPHLCGELRRDIYDRLAVMDEAVGDVFADAVATLDRPDALGVRPTGREHIGIASLVGAEPADRQNLGSFVDDLDRRRSLVWIHPDDHSHRCLL